jgi:putative MATE family efflux protein
VSETNPAEEIVAVEEMTARTAVRQGDLTQGPILRTLLLFSIPTLFSNVLQTLGGTINTIWVGQLLGERALAATANANMAVFLAFAAVFGFGMATTVKVGQYFGARDIEGARRTFGTGTGFCTAIAVIGGLAGWNFAEPLLHLLATPPSIHDNALAYLRVSFLWMPFGTLSMMVSMGLRGVGDAKTPLYAMIMTTMFSVVLNPLLILGIGPFPRWGIAGSAVSLVLAQFLGLVTMLVWTYWRDLPLRLRGRELLYLLPLRDELGYVLGKGLPMGAQMLVNSSASLIMVGLVNREGMMTTAGYSAVLQIWSYIQMPSFAISMAVSAMVAQNIGASQHDRVGAITIAGIMSNCVITTGLTLLLLAFDGPLLGLFLGEHSPAIPIAERLQLLSTWSWILSGVMMILSGTMRSYGVVIIPLIIMAISLFAARLGFYQVMHPVLGADALWWAYPFGSAVALVLTWFAYARPGWRRDQLVAMPRAALAE